jgi:hypothetical protein
MIHAETDSCIAALDLDATSAVESKLRKFCRPCRAIMSIMELAMAKILILPEAARGPFRVLVVRKRSGRRIDVSRLGEVAMHGHFSGFGGFSDRRRC